ncbi:P-loop containing nucleoside triphosphate hydrolase protein [Amanita muscaria]
MSLAFWKPGTSGPGSSLDRATEVEGNLFSAQSGFGGLSTEAQRQFLPIYKHKDKLLHSIEKYGVTIIVGQTGCGKTTQLPQYLLEAGWANEGSTIVCTQPRRVAASSVAARVAAEMGTVLGEEVGYTIRFEDVSNKQRTRIIYMTDGMLFRQIMLDPLLSRYSVVMIDEAHERSVYTDLLLGILKKIRRKRPSLRIIVSSATLDASSFQGYFSDSINETAIVSLEGRMYPVEIAYLEEPVVDYTKKAAEVVWDINLQMASGDILIFLTGREDIERCLQILMERLSTLPRHTSRLLLLPLHAGLTTEEQIEVFKPTERGFRKVIAATNVAEASITIDGIRFVIDCGFVKVRAFNPSTAIASLATIPVSVASATQRAGRAGRTSPGICYRLYPESTFRALPLSTPPEITRADLMTPLLQLKSLGIHNVMTFEWVTSPPGEAIVRALEGLIAAEMIGRDGHLTSTGERVVEIPLEVGLARMLLKAADFQCGEEILSVIALTAVQDVFVIPEGSQGVIAEMERRKFIAEEGDHLTLLNVYNAFVRYGQSSNWCKSHALSFRALSRAMSIRSQIRKYMQRFNIPVESCRGDERRLRRCLVTGYWRNVATWVADGTYRSLQGDKVFHVHPTSTLFNRTPRSGWVVYHEVEETKKIQIRILTEIEPDWSVTCLQ